MNARRSKSAEADGALRARRNPTSPSYAPSVYGSTHHPADDHEIPFPRVGDVWIGDAYVCVVPVPADEWPAWTDAVAFGEGPGHANA